MVEFDGNSSPAPYEQGPPVDASGVTPQGDTFSGSEEYQRLLIERELDPVARHLASQFLVLATGAEIEFADRNEVERILAAVRGDGYPVRRMIHEVVQSTSSGATRTR